MLRKLSPLLVLLLLILFIWFSFYSSRPQNISTREVPESEFSTLRAFDHVQRIGEVPHFVGSPAHSRVRTYIVNEMQEMGLEVQTQEGYTLSKNGTITLPRNILARIPGTGTGKSLLLMSHYDSAGHSSPGASDAASGVATILEGIRAFLAKGDDHQNDIIILFTDAEELGLNGARLYIGEHPWAGDTGLALNFEARGSGGDSFMLLETNAGNAGLIEHFINANPGYPVTNSLAYSVYKMLPNDTDLTVLREQGDINGFNFAFIDDHYDYHTENDTPENLDLKTLAHQGSYLMPLLDYFKDADLTDLDADQDYIYFTLPGGVMISYPFTWSIPLLILAFLLFFVVVIYGIGSKRIELKSVFSGAVPFLISLIGSGLLVYLLWKFCLFIYPEYSEMEHGFTYNGYYYIAASIFLALTITFFSYDRFKPKEKPAGFFVFPLFFWLLICTLTAFFLKGAAYFVIPAIFATLQLFVMVSQQRPNLFLMLLLSLPALIVLQPFIVMFPVALGLGILFVSAILTVLLYILFLPVFNYFSRKIALSLLCFVIFNVLFITAHFKSSFNEERQKPNSLVYLLDTDSGSATWNSYDEMVDTWTEPFFGKDPVIVLDGQDFSSKYGSSFTYKTAAPVVEVPEPVVVFKRQDTVASTEGIRSYALKIAPTRKINRMEIFVDRKVNFEELTVNGLEADSLYLGTNPFHVFKKRWNNRLLTYHAANQDTLRLEFSLQGEEVPEFLLYESSYDLLENEALNVPPREETMIPRPFVLNDAVMLKKTITLD